MLKRGEHEAAMEMLAEASQLRPTDVELAETVAELLCEARKRKEAREFAERAVALEGDSVRGFKVLGQVFKAKGDVAKARKHLQRAWELNTMDPEVRAELQTL